LATKGNFAIFFQGNHYFFLHWAHGGNHFGSIFLHTNSTAGGKAVHNNKLTLFGNNFKYATIEMRQTI